MRVLPASSRLLPASQAKQGHGRRGMGTAAPPAPGPASQGLGGPRRRPEPPATHMLAAGRVPRHAAAARRIWPGAARSVTASPRPQEGNAPPQGLLAAWYPPRAWAVPPLPTPGAAASHRAPPAAPHGSPAWRAPAALLLPAPACSFPRPVGAGSSGCPGLPRARRSCVPATWRAAIRSRRREGRSRGGQEPEPTALPESPRGCAQPGRRRMDGAEQRLVQPAAAELEGGHGSCAHRGGAAHPVGAATPSPLAVPARLRHPPHLGCAAGTWLRSQHQPLARGRGLGLLLPPFPPQLLPATPAPRGHPGGHALSPRCRGTSGTCLGGWQSWGQSETL